MYIPDRIGSYSEHDVKFLLRDLSHIELEKSVEERELNIQSGKMHYSEMLPIEYQPNAQYMALYEEILEHNAEKVAQCVATVTEKVIAVKGLDNLVLVSLARAGTPIGILMKRYIMHFYEVDVPHYSISIIRDRGIDETAIQYIFQQHPQASIQFVDGWTGKGAITRQLEQAVQMWNERFSQKLDETIAVLADPGYCAHYFGTQEDFLIPSACLNSTVSGLVSRTVLNDAFMEPGDFHGAKYYQELETFDVSNSYIETITAKYDISMAKLAKEQAKEAPIVLHPSWQGMRDIEVIQQQFDIRSTHHIKPGVGETTRVLLRRIPWKVLVNPNATQNLEHIYLLAKERGVAVEMYENMPYACCGLIKDLKR